MSQENGAGSQIRTLKKLFNVEIGEDENSGLFRVNVFSVTENKGRSFEGVQLRTVMSEASKAIRQKVRELHKFPLPEPSRIIGVANGAPSLIVPGRN